MVDLICECVDGMDIVCGDKDGKGIRKLYKEYNFGFSHFTIY